MNKCIVDINENRVLVTFYHIVNNGSIDIWKDEGKKKPLLVYSKKVKNSIFENIGSVPGKGSYKMDIDMDGEIISKTIKIF